MHWEVSTSDGILVFKCLLEVWPCVFIRYANVLGHGGRTYQSRNTRCDVAVFCSCDIEPGQMSIFISCIDYFGHVICPRRLQISMRTVETVEWFVHPINVWELRLISGLCSLFVSCSAESVHISVLLNKNLPKGHLQTFHELMKHEIGSMQALQVKLIEPPVPVLQCSDGNYMVRTDECNKQARYVLLPKGQLLPTGMWRMVPFT